MSVASFTKTGTKRTTAVKLPASVFAVAIPNHELLKLVYTAEESNKRYVLAQTKTRGEVRGGGKKPWRQKGTGRARFGSSRNPIWRGGGIAFGPRATENFTKKVNATAKRVALAQAFTLAAKSQSIAVIESIDAKSGKSKDVAETFKKIGLADTNVLFITGARDDMLLRAARNIANISLVSARSVTTKQVLDASSILLTDDAITALETRIEGARS